MRRFILAAVLAAAGALGTADRADAQYVYQYNTVNPYTGGIVSNSGVYTPFGAQANYGYYNPWTGATGQRSLYQNAYGTSIYRAAGVNPLLGRGYSTGSYYPGFGVSPYAGSVYNYRYFR